MKKINFAEIISIGATGGLLNLVILPFCLTSFIRIGSLIKNTYLFTLTGGYFATTLAVFFFILMLFLNFFVLFLISNIELGIVKIFYKKSGTLNFISLFALFGSNIVLMFLPKMLGFLSCIYFVVVLSNLFVIGYKISMIGFFSSKNEGVKNDNDQQPM